MNEIVANAAEATSGSNKWDLLTAHKNPPNIDEDWREVLLSHKKQPVVENVDSKIDLEEKSSQEIIADINFSEQSKATQEAIEKYGPLFTERIILDGKNFLGFLDKKGEDGRYVFLVNSDEHPDVYKIREFRLSGSDHQIKSLPGMRDFEMGIYLKGNEDDPNHHYVQSAKIDPRLYQFLQDMPIAKKDSLSDKQKVNLQNNYLVERDSIMYNQDDGAHAEDFSFSEEQVQYKDQRWNEIKSKLLGFEGLNQRLNKYAQGERPETFFNDFNTMKMSDDPEIAERKTELVKWINKGEEKKKKGEITQQFFLDKVYDRVKKFEKEMAPIMAEKLIRTRIFNQMEEAGMIPDFTEQPVAIYNKGDIVVEEFDAISSKGDIMRWAMAEDKKGRVYIDNIYDPTVGIDDYGTPKKKLNMGMLVYKPEDYNNQIEHIPKQYVKPVIDNNGKNNDTYSDINDYISQQYPIQKYIKSKRVVA